MRGVSFDEIMHCILQGTIGVLEHTHTHTLLTASYDENEGLWKGLVLIVRK